MVTMSTHDTKRGEDAAARIAVLSEMPLDWQQAVTRWSRRAEPHRGAADDRPAPSRRDEYTFYQTLVGAWPFGWDGRGDRQPLIERLTACMDKAAKEAKIETSWIRPNPAYDQALRGFVEGVMRDDGLIDDMRRFMARLETYGASNALAQALLRLTVPGIPDTYQGSELWNQSLVDPDNRRPVDFAARGTLLNEIERRLGDPAALARDLLGRWTDGGVKLFVTHLALRTRASLPDVFLRGEYVPLDGGPHTVAFARTARDAARVVAVAPRLTLKLTGGRVPWALGSVWGDQTLAIPDGTYRDAFTGRAHRVAGSVRMADILADFPVALLVESQ
jgi:(1->4)-alpha-D-glucan 1-alpha-D-glucosylmutase